MFAHQKALKILHRFVCWHLARYEKGQRELETHEQRKTIAKQTGELLQFASKFVAEQSVRSRSER